MNLFAILANFAASNVLVQALLSAVATVTAGQVFTTPPAVVTVAGKRYDVSLNVKEHVG